MDQKPDEAPRERAPLLLIFGHHADRMANLVRAKPILIARLIVAPREAVHSVGAFLHLAADAGRCDHEVAALINDSDPRALLAAALPGAPAKLYRALDRAGDRVRGRVFYERVGAICRGPFVDAFLDGGAIDDGRLGFYEALAKMDPAIASLRGILPESQFDAEGINALILFLRRHGVFHDDDIRMPPKSGFPALARRFRQMLDRIPAPDPGFSPPAPWRLIGSTAELQQIGKAFGNCVALPSWHAAQHHFRLLDGTGVYLTADEPRALAALRRVGPALWILDQIAGPKNAALPSGAQTRLLADLAGVGVVVVQSDPQSALGRLTSQSQHRRIIDDDDLDEEGDDEGEIAA